MNLLILQVTRIELVYDCTVVLNDCQGWDWPPVSNTSLQGLVVITCPVSNRGGDNLVSSSSLIRPCFHGYKLRVRSSPYFGALHSCMKFFAPPNTFAITPNSFTISHELHHLNFLSHVLSSLFLVVSIP